MHDPINLASREIIKKIIINISNAIMKSSYFHQILKSHAKAFSAPKMLTSERKIEIMQQLKKNYLKIMMSHQ